MAETWFPASMLGQSGFVRSDTGIVQWAKVSSGLRVGLTFNKKKYFMLLEYDSLNQDVKRKVLGGYKIHFKEQKYVQSETPKAARWLVHNPRYKSLYYLKGYRLFKRLPPACRATGH